MARSYANRGTGLEELIMYANAQYQRKGLARIDKFPTPITPERVTKDGKVYGFFSNKSTVDYIGTIKSGISICFDCKETAHKNRLPLSNIHQHQIDYMENVSKIGGIAFLVVRFTHNDRFYRLDFATLNEYWQVYEKTAGHIKRASGTASIPLEAFTTEVIPEKGLCLHYLKGIVD